MERDLLQREILALEIALKFKQWTYPGSAFYASQTGDLSKLFEGSLIFGEYYRNALKRKFSLHGRISIFDTGTFARFGGSADALGWTDKKNGRAFLVEFHKSGHSSIEAAIHEAFHLISFPLKGKTDRDIAFSAFGSPLMEAVTQYFTRVLMIEIGIKNWKTKVYQKNIDNYLKPFFNIFALLKIDPQKRMTILCELVFNFNYNLMVNCISQQLRALNSSLTEREADNWATNTYLLLTRHAVKEACRFIEFILKSEYDKANKLRAEVLANNRRN